MFFRDAQCAIVVFDLSNRVTFDSVDSWITQVRESAPDCEIALIGNKLDLPEQRAVSFSDGHAKAETLKCTFYSETSAVTGQGVGDLFERFVTSPGVQKYLFPGVAAV
jgi:GTPase SAR1 family protein